MNTVSETLPLPGFQQAAKRLKKVVHRTPLSYNTNLSRKYQCKVYLKREDLQIVRSYKIRGAYNMMSCLSSQQLQQGVTTASAGNHAQGFAYSCNLLNAKGVVFMPAITPRQKINQTWLFGENNIDIKLVGTTFDDCLQAARQYTLEHGMTFIPPFDDHRIIEGQSTVAMEILEDVNDIDYLFIPVGGGGLAAGMGSYFRSFSPQTKIIGTEPAGAPSMTAALAAGYPVTLNSIDAFVDGAAVKRVGDLTFQYCKNVLDEMHLVQEGKICSTILQLYNEEAMVVEPAGALAIAALDDYADVIRNKTIVCVVSGSNNDFDRLTEIKERSVRYEQRSS